MAELTIAVVSDVICPWCYLGKRRLERALETLDLAGAVRVRWLPYELNPEMPADGMPRAEYRARKFGPERSARADADLTRLGEEEGVAFAFSRIARTPNTRAAHALIEHAAARGLDEEVVEGLFRAYFEDARDIGRPEELVEIAGAAGLDAAEVRGALEDRELRERVVALEGEAARLGIAGVPFFVLNGAQALSGAQSTETWIEILRRAVSVADASGAAVPA